MIRLYNTLGRRLEEFKPLDDSRIRLYTCGPTVYDYAHIGNLRSFVFDDSLRRMLQLSGYDVSHVMNITDVGHLASDADEGEDKLEKGAEREKQSVWEVAQRYIDAFKRDMDELNVLPPDVPAAAEEPYARATDYIGQQIELVQQLFDKGFAYKAASAVYFDVSKLSDYGKLTGQKLSDKEVGARGEVIVDSDKHNPQDFALWFFKIGRFANHSMSWPSPWGEGFPGWHLECSAIIHATLGEPIDIHTGGVDHIGTHHTNEIAQTEAAYGKPLAKFWLHNEHLLVENSKMSKSKGNYLTMDDVISRGYQPLALRLLFLQSHYRSQTNFTWEALTAAAKNLSDLRAMADLRFQAADADGVGSHEIAQVRRTVIDCLQDDLSTPTALAAVSSLADRLNAGGLSNTAAEDFTAFLKTLDEGLGLRLLDSQDIDERQKQLIKDRAACRQAGDWTTSDRLRGELKQSGLDILDTGYGQIWRRA